MSELFSRYFKSIPNLIWSTLYALLSIVVFFILQIIVCLTPIILYCVLVYFYVKNITSGELDPLILIQSIIFLPIGFIFAFGGSAKILTDVIQSLHKASSKLPTQHGVVQDSRITSLIETVTRDIGILPFEGIYFDLEPDFSTFYLGKKRYIVLGLAALKYLTEEEFKAVIAHECAHYHNNSMLLNRTHYRARILFETYENTLRAVYSSYSGIKTNNKLQRYIINNYGLSLFFLFTPLIKLYSGFFSLVGTLIRNPRYEYYCDYVAAKYTGGNILVSALQKIYDLQIAHYEICKKQYLFADARFNHVEKSYLKNISEELNRVRFKNPKIRIEAAKFSTATHPSLISRIEKIESINLKEDDSDFLLSEATISSWAQKLPLVDNLSYQSESLPPMIESVVYLIIAAILLFAYISFSSSLREIRATQTELVIENLNSEIPVIQELSRYEPETYKQFKQNFSEAINTGEDKEETIDTIKPYFQEIFNLVYSKYLPVASDESILNFSTYLYDNIFENDEDCYAYFAQGYISEYNDDNFHKILVEVVRTGAETPTQLNDISSAQLSLAQIQEGLASTYGDDLAMLQDRRKKGADKQKICIMASDMYRRILQLPKEESATLLRYLLANQNRSN